MLADSYEGLSQCRRDSAIGARVWFGRHVGSLSPSGSCFFGGVQPATWIVGVIDVGCSDVGGSRAPLTSLIRALQAEGADCATRNSPIKEAHAPSTRSLNPSQLARPGFPSRLFIAAFPVLSALIRERG